jgi:GNAT superfamily N-acetyltransferase
MNSAIFNFKNRGVEMEAHETPWDTKALGFPAGRITRFHGRDIQSSKMAFSDLFAWASTSGIEFLSCRLDSSRLHESFALESAGFRFVETLLHPYLDVDNIKGSDYGEIEIYEAENHEVSFIADMASKSFTAERFHADFRVSNDAANQRYANWIVNSRDDEKFKLYKAQLTDGEIIGFFLVSYEETRRVNWELTAIFPEFQGKGFGRQTWNSFIAFHKKEGVTRISTSITARNSNILSLYSLLGFKFSSPDNTYHWLSG